MTQTFAVLVLSCDKYADIWPAFFKCFRDNFPELVCKIYIGSNTKVCQEHGVITLLSGTDTDWSTSYKNILAQIPEQKLFVILEDLLIKAPIDIDLFLSTLSFMSTTDANHIQYWAGSQTEEEQPVSPYISKLTRCKPYRALVCGFWDRECLMKLLLEGESPWNFEILGSYRTSYADGYYSLTRPLLECTNMIEKGKWIPESVNWAEARSIQLEIDARPILQGGNQVISRLQMFYFRWVVRISWKKRVALMNMLRKVLISY